MRTIRGFLRAADRVARKLKVSCSTLVRRALQAHLGRIETRDKEKVDRDGFTRYPDSLDEPAIWDRVAAVPEERDRRASRLQALTQSDIWEATLK